jgi:hypothetical protein
MLEILGVKRLDPLPFKDITYSHPSMKRRKLIEGAKRTRRTAVKDPKEDYELDPHHRPARINVNQSVADMTATSFEFIRLPKFKRSSINVAIIHDGSTEEGSSSLSTGTKARLVKPRGTTVSTDESYYGGEIQPVDFLGIDLGVANLAGLKDFIEAVQHIMNNYVEPHLRYTVMEIPASNLSVASPAAPSVRVQWWKLLKPMSFPATFSKSPDPTAGRCQLFSFAYCRNSIQNSLLDSSQKNF